MILEYTLGNEDTKVYKFYIIILIYTWYTLGLDVDIFILITVHNISLPIILISMWSDTSSREVQEIISIYYQRKVEIGWDKNNPDQLFPNIIIPLQKKLVANWNNQQEAYFSKKGCLKNIDTVGNMLLFGSNDIILKKKRMW